MWKVTNIAKVAQDIKIAAAKSNTVTVGVILKPGQFCIVSDHITSSMDAQRRRNFISIEENVDNNLKLNLCEAYDQTDIEKARQEATDYKG
jgi:hypothetical protein